MVPPVSVEADQVKLICEMETAVAERLEGAVKIGADVVAVAVGE